MVQLSEITFPEAIECGAEQLSCAADKIMNLWLKRPAVAVVPGIGRDVAIVLEYRRRIPVFRFPLEPVAALENQDVLSRRCEASSESATTGAAADDNDVEALVHGNSIRDQRCCALCRRPQKSWSRSNNSRLLRRGRRQRSQSPLGGPYDRAVWPH